MAREDDKFEELKSGLPLGLDSVQNAVLAQKQGKPLTQRLTCVTGNGRSAFIRRLLLTVSCLYEKSEACFFVLSPRAEYGELLRLRSADVTVPYIRNKEDLEAAVKTLKELIDMRKEGKGYPRLILILDGLDELPECNENGDFEEYRDIYDILMRRVDVDVITGAELMKSIFSGYPGAFVGVGNCLVSTREEGKADVTYVNDDSSLTLPIPMTYPSEPSVMESIIFLNSVPSAAPNQAEEE
jgi:hypothetical protein